MLPPTTWGLSGSPGTPSTLVDLQPIAEHRFSKPIFLTASPDETPRLFVAEQDGRILIIQENAVRVTPFLDISQKLSTGGERGLLGLAFHPNFSSNSRFFVNYTRAQDGATVIAEYQASPDPNRADPNESVLLVIPQPYGNHNGGMIAFGPDHYLYIGMGDGGSGGDPENYAQRRTQLLGKILRIDVDQPSPYGIPADNPILVGKGNGRPEIFAWGFRNPWRFSFDRKTGDLWAGDVGQNEWEEIDIVEKGKNYGWRFLEGTHCYHPKTQCRQVNFLIDPVKEYSHSSGRCSITGGYVYRGAKIPALQESYIYGDFCTGEIWEFRRGKSPLLVDTELNISSFGEDQDGELYVIGHGGQVLKIVPKVISPQP